MPDSPALPLRPVLKSGLRRVWRDRSTLQIGFGRRHAIVVRDLGLPAGAFLDRLDGTVPLAQVDSLAREVGLDPGTAHELLRLLCAHGVVGDAATDRSDLRALRPDERDRIAPDLDAWALASSEPDAAERIHGRRRRARVDVHGAGRVGALAAALLAHAGIGELRVIDASSLRAGDVPAPWARPAPADPDAPPTRADVVLDVCEQIAPSLSTPRSQRASTQPDDDRPAVVLLAPVDTLGTVDLELRDQLVRDGVPHLPAYLRETLGVVGPFVVPGRGPCLRCLDLVRADRDAAWPHLLAQLAPPPTQATRTRGIDDASDGVLAATIASQAVLQVLCHVDGGTPSATGTTIETEAYDGLTRQRAWPAHPACGCQWT